MHAAEHVLAVAEHVRDAAVGGDVDGAPRLGVGHAPHDHHAARVGGRRAKRGDERGHVEVEDQLAVDRDEGLVGSVGVEERQRVLDAASGAEDRILVVVLDPRTPARAVAEARRR